MQYFLHLLTVPKVLLLFNTQYAMSIYEQFFPTHDVTELMHITRYN